jgi:acetoin utilization deacetylase AcuC-like enzyme
MTKFQSFTHITHPEYAKHDTGGGEHPEISNRVIAIRDKLQDSLLTPSLTELAARRAEREHVLSFHDDAYLYRFEEACLSGRTDIDHQDNQICFDSYDTALLSAGAGLTGIDLLEDDGAKIVFCSVRPPGHHAERSQALGFCFINNVVIAARYWQKSFSREKIFVIDWDAHHGNGIQAAFEEDPSVFYVSIHEHPTYSFPGTGYADDKGTGAGIGTTLNIPLPPDAGDEMVLDALKNIVGPAIDKFKPDAIIVAAGFDGHLLDDMSGLAYTTTLYGKIGIWMNAWAKQYCNGKIISILEGGYNIEALAASVEAYIAGLTALKQGGE